MRLDTSRDLFLAVCLFFSLAAPARPQTSAGTVRGTVRDQSGAVVPGADVTLTNVATGVAARTRTNATGFYTFPALTPGSYRIAVESPGMKKFEGSLTVQVQQAAAVDAVLPVAQAVSEIVVSDVTPAVNLDKALEEQLFPLLLQEQALLEDHGKDHPTVLAVRKKILRV